MHMMIEACNNDNLYKHCCLYVGKYAFVAKLEDRKKS